MSEDIIECICCYEDVIKDDKNKKNNEYFCDRCLGQQKYFEDKAKLYDRMMEKKYPNWKNISRRERKNLSPPSSDNEY